LNAQVVKAVIRINQIIIGSNRKQGQITETFHKVVFVMRLILPMMNIVPSTVVFVRRLVVINLSATSANRHKHWIIVMAVWLVL